MSHPTTSQGRLWTRRPARRFIRALAAALLIGGSLASATAAHAHGTSATLYNTDGRAAGHGGVTASHHNVYVCDDLGDSQGVFIEWGANPFGGRLTDQNGSASGCQSSYWNPTIYNFRICSDSTFAYKRCTSWRTA